VWAPVFVAGCFLIDNPAAWLCDISPKFRRVEVGETGYRSEYDPWEENSDPVVATLANMLGVKYVGGDAPPLASQQTARPVARRLIFQLFPIFGNYC
jgi:hypothetical protein